MTQPPEELASRVRQIHASPHRAVLAVTGGGAGALAALLREPGASQTVLECRVPYAAAAVIELLGAPPEQYCSPRTARALAMAAFLRAAQLAAREAQLQGDSPTALPPDPRLQLIGVGCTASLASTRPKRGEHRAHVAAQSADTTRCASLMLTKGARSRRDEDDLVSRLVLDQLAEACGLDQAAPPKLLASDQLRHEAVTAEPAWRDVLLGRKQAACVRGGPPPSGSPAVVFPGAFNPLHEGHRRMAAIAEQRLGAPVQFELSLWNVDKPPLDYVEIAQRLGQFDPGRAVWLTRCPTFVEKAAAFPGAVFVVGADTIARIADPKYYGGDERKRDEAIRRIEAAKCRFLVFGRSWQGRFATLQSLPLPRPLARLCAGVPPEAFRLDISSTELRRPPPAS